MRAIAIQVRGLDEGVLAALKARASRHRRSLPSEVKRILEEATRPVETPAPRGSRKLRLRTVSIGAPISYSRATIYGDGRR
jgi:plasmid stability protein